MASFEILKGKTISRILGLEPGSEAVNFFTADGQHYRLAHQQNCCESVAVEDIIGDVQDVIGSPLLLAECVEDSDQHPEGKQPEYQPDSFTWTFYKLSTIKGSVTIRWYGTSNGYYSESVDFEEVE